MNSRKERILQSKAVRGMGSKKVLDATEQSSCGMDSRKVNILQSRAVRGIDSRKVKMLQSKTVCGIDSWNLLDATWFFFYNCNICIMSVIVFARINLSN